MARIGEEEDMDSRLYPPPFDGVALHNGESRFTVPGEDGLNDGYVQAVRVHLTRVRAHRFNDLVAECQHGLYQTFEKPVATHLRQDEVDQLLSFDVVQERCEGKLLRVQCRLEPVRILRRDVPRGRAGHLRLDEHSHLVELWDRVFVRQEQIEVGIGKLLEGEVGDKSTARGPLAGTDKPGIIQCPQSLAYRHAADLELFSELPLGRQLSPILNCPRRIDRLSCPATSSETLDCLIGLNLVLSVFFKDMTDLLLSADGPMAHRHHLRGLFELSEGLLIYLEYALFPGTNELCEEPKVLDLEAFILVEGELVVGREHVRHYFPCCLECKFSL